MSIAALEDAATAAIAAAASALATRQAADLALVDARAAANKAAKAAQGALAAKQKAEAAGGGGGGGGGGAPEFLIKNDKWVICQGCNAKLRNDSVVKKSHVCTGGGGGAAPDPAKLAALEAAARNTAAEQVEADEAVSAAEAAAEKAIAAASDAEAAKTAATEVAAKAKEAAAAAAARATDAAAAAEAASTLVASSDAVAVTHATSSDAVTVTHLVHVGERIEVEVEEVKGQIEWRHASVHELLEGGQGRFSVKIDDAEGEPDEEFIEEYGPEDEGSEWRKLPNEVQLTKSKHEAPGAVEAAAEKAAAEKAAAEKAAAEKAAADRAAADRAAVDRAAADRAAADKAAADKAAADKAAADKAAAEQKAAADRAEKNAQKVAAEKARAELMMVEAEAKRKSEAEAAAAVEAKRKSEEAARAAAEAEAAAAAQLEAEANATVSLRWPRYVSLAEAEINAKAAAEAQVAEKAAAKVAELEAAKAAELEKVSAAAAAEILRAEAEAKARALAVHDPDSRLPKMLRQMHAEAAALKASKLREAALSKVAAEERRSLEAKREQQRQQQQQQRQQQQQQQQQQQRQAAEEPEDFTEDFTEDAEGVATGEAPVTAPVTIRGSFAKGTSAEVLSRAMTKALGLQVTIRRVPRSSKNANEGAVSGTAVPRAPGGRARVALSTGGRPDAVAGTRNGGAAPRGTSSAALSRHVAPSRAAHEASESDGGPSAVPSATCLFGSAVPSAVPSAVGQERQMNPRDMAARAAAPRASTARSALGSPRDNQEGVHAVAMAALVEAQKQRRPSPDDVPSPPSLPRASRPAAAAAAAAAAALAAPPPAAAELDRGPIMTVRKTLPGKSTSVLSVPLGVRSASSRGSSGGPFSARSTAAAAVSPPGRPLALGATPPSSGSVSLSKSHSRLLQWTSGGE